MTDDELIERIAEAILTASLSYSGPGGQTVPHVMPVHMDVARVALAVARPVIRSEVLDEAEDILSVAMNADLEKYNARGVSAMRLAARSGGWLYAWEAVRSLRSDSKGDSDDAAPI